VRIGRDAGYEGLVLSAGGRLSRTEIHARLDGTGAECRLDGAVLVRGRQHADITTDIEHASGFAQSRQMFKAVLDDQSRSVFQGRVVVAKEAQRTDALQSNRNLLLSRGAQADSKPELIIHADDVKCSHGATVGDLDRNALFYLRARGIDERTARSLLIEGFVGELVEAAPGEAVRARVERSIGGWLAGMGRAREAA
jgi:Fe-S cluster assembly protein SufD